MNQQDMKKRTVLVLRQILKDDLILEIEPSSIRDDDDLQAVTGLDSVGLVELRVACEQRFNIQILDDEFPRNFRSLNTLASLIERLEV